MPDSGFRLKVNAGGGCAAELDGNVVVSHVMAAGADAYQLSPVAAAIIGFGVTGVGAFVIVVGRRLTSGMNRLYAALPGNFRYPDWFIPLIGTLVAIFGLLVAGLALAFGAR